MIDKLFKKWLGSLDSKRLAGLVASAVVAGLVILGDRFGYELDEQAKLGLGAWAATVLAGLWADTESPLHGSKSTRGLWDKLIGSLGSKRLIPLLTSGALSLLMAFGEALGATMDEQTQAGLLGLIGALLAGVWVDTRRKLHPPEVAPEDDPGDDW